jgi:hypothetical protein
MNNLATGCMQVMLQIGAAKYTASHKQLHIPKIDVAKTVMVPMEQEFLLLLFQESIVSAHFTLLITALRASAPRATSLK